MVLSLARKVNLLLAFAAACERESTDEGGSSDSTGVDVDDVCRDVAVIDCIELDPRAPYAPSTCTCCCIGGPDAAQCPAGVCDGGAS